MQRCKFPVFLAFLSALFLSPAATLSAGAEEEAPLQYTVEEITGMVFVVPSGGGASQPLTEGSPVLAGDEIQTDEGGSVVLFLNEETTLRVESASRLVVERLEPNQEGGFLNRLKLLAGRVISEVENLGKSQSTFEVESGGVVCGVRGTSFEVELIGDEVNASTYEGEIEVKSGESVERVRAGYRFGFMNKRALMKRKLDRSERERFMKWKEHRLQLRERFHERLKAKPAVKTDVLKKTKAKRRLKRARR